MRIQYQIEGGLFYSNLNKPVTFDLDGQEAHAVQQLLPAAQVAPAPKKPKKLTMQTADKQRYKVTIEDQGKSSVIELHDTMTNPQQRQLLELLKAKAAQARTAGKK